MGRHAAVAGKSNDASTAPKVADTATGQKEATSASNDKNNIRDTPNPAKRGITEDHWYQFPRGRLSLLKHHQFLMRMT